MESQTLSFGQKHFGGVDLGDERRNRRLPLLVDEMIRHPGGTLPEKLPRPADQEAFYRLCDADDVTHATVLKPHRARTLQILQTTQKFLLVLTTPPTSITVPAKRSSN
jgi:Transposase DNA-binding